MHMISGMKIECMKAQWSTTMANGIDVSYWNGTIDWQKASSKLGQDGFTYIRATFAYASMTDGAHIAVDSNLSTNWAGAASSGVKRGVYAYYHQLVSAGDQLITLLRAVNTDWGELPPAVDVEQEIYSSTNQPMSWTMQQNLDFQWFMWALERCSGRIPIIYTRATYWDEFIGLAPGRTDNTWANHYGLWVADWRQNARPLLPGVWNDFTIWQYSAQGNHLAAAYGAQGDDIDLDTWTK